MLGSLFVSSLVVTAAASGQEVRSIEINPVSLTLQVGEQRTILATPRDTRGNPLITSDLSWSTNDPSILQVSYDPNTPNVVTVTAVSPGTASIEARSGRVTSRMAILVEGAPAPPALPDSVLPPDVVAATLPLVARIEARVFGATPVCAIGGFIGNDLLLTTYTAIRGADRVSVTLRNGRTIDNVNVATHDVQANLAVLQVPNAGAGSMTPGSDPSTNVRGWALGQPSCSQTVPIPVEVTTRGGAVTADRDLNTGQLGAPIVDRAGNLIAMAVGGRNAVAISSLAAITNRARANASVGTIAAPGEVADRENHRYGTIIVRSDATGMRGRVTPLEDHHWPELGTTGGFPLTVNGPVGRYRVELMAGGQVRNTETFEIVAGQTNRQSINLPVVAPPAQQPPAEEQVSVTSGGGGGVSPAIILLGLAAAGGGAFLILGGGGGVDPCDENPSLPECRDTNPPGTGTITIRIPIP